MGMSVEEWKDKIIEHEGYRVDPYTDTEGFMTGGIGHKFTKSDIQNFDTQWPDEKKHQYWEQRFEEDFSKAVKKSGEFMDSYGMPPNDKVHYVLTDMVFNMGAKGVAGFPTFLNDLANGDLEGATTEMMYTNKTKSKKSKWYTQVGRRVEDLVDILRSSNESN